MRKMLFVYAGALSLLLFTMESCHNNNDSTQGSTVGSSQSSASGEWKKKVIVDPDESKSKSAYELAKNRIIQLSECMDTIKTCVYYCDTPGCLKRVEGCHHIDTGTFNNLTSRGLNPHDVIKGTDIQALLKNAKCEDFIRISADVTSGPNLYVLRVDSATGHGNGNTAEFIANYSAALFKQITIDPKNPIVSVELFKCFIHEGNYLVPFSVHFSNGDVKFYDVSNDLP